MNRLRVVALASGVYDLVAGAVLLFGRSWFSRVFDVPPASPPIHAELNGIFLIAVALGYLWPSRDPDAGRAYLWVMGPFLKGAAAAMFVADYLTRRSPASFLLFAASDGALALITLWALTSPSSSSTSK